MKIRVLLCRLSFACAGCFALIGASRPALALQPDEIALVVNSNVPQSTELAQFYAQQRHIPDNRILVLDLPKEDQMTCKEYEDVVVPQVRDFLGSVELKNKVKCLVTFYGVPLRIDPRVNTAEEGDELTMVRKRLMALPGEITPDLVVIENLAKKLSITFNPDNGTDLDHLINRRDAAFHEIFDQIQGIPEKDRQAELASQFFGLAYKLTGDRARINKTALDFASHPSTQPAIQDAFKKSEQQYNDLIHEAGNLEDKPNDPQARQRLRQIVEDHFGLFQYVNLLRDQADYLNPDQSGAAFDNELAMVAWNVYPRKLSVPNPLFYTSTGPKRWPTYMVCRLDAPQPDTVKAIITNSIKVEHQGLNGIAVIDSLGVRTGEEKPAQRGYGQYDQYLRNLADLLRKHTNLQVVLDEKPEVLPAGSEKDVALYVGWYSVHNYIPCCAFNPGAVGYHIASFELTTLRTPGESGWVHGLLNDGVVATLGAVNEPYLASFPRPDDFFPLLLTGKLTFAEVYWKTEPSVSWMQACIGDPLYTPYLNNPKLNPHDLPLRLQPVLTPSQVTSIPGHPS